MEVSIRLALSFFIRMALGGGVLGTVHRAAILIRVCESDLSTLFISYFFLSKGLIVSRLVIHALICKDENGYHDTTRLAEVEG